jgi:hypothetical protein
MSKKLSALIGDLKDIIYSYLSLEEILFFFKDNRNYRDKFLIKYPHQFPNINDASVYGHLETVKYLIEKGIQPTSETINFASANGHLSVIQYLMEYGTIATDYSINAASAYGYLEVVKYLVDKGVQPTSAAIICAHRNEYFDIVEYLESKI